VSGTANKASDWLPFTESIKSNNQSTSKRISDDNDEVILKKLKELYIIN